MSATDTRTVVGVFDDSTTAQRVVDELVSSGFSRDRISIHSSNDYASNTALGNTAFTGDHPHDASGGGIGGFFRRLFGADDDVRHYDEAVRRGSTVVTVDTDDANDERAADILDRYGAVDIDQRAATWHDEGYTDRTTDRSTTDRAIPVVQEELQVGKREVRRGGVRVFNRVVEEPVEQQVHLREEHVRVERRPVNRQATEGDLRATDEVIEVTEMAEEPVVGKTARVVEEVIVGKEVTDRTETIRDTVRRSDVKVEQGGVNTSDYDNDFRSHFTSHYGSTKGARYETFAPSYQYGYRMASDQRYQGRSWNDVESTLRSDYERNYPNSKWEQMKDSVRYGWEKVSGRR